MTKIIFIQLLLHKLHSRWLYLTSARHDMT